MGDTECGKEQYAKGLEDDAARRNVELVAQKAKTDKLVHRLLPP